MRIGSMNAVRPLEIHNHQRLLVFLAPDCQCVDLISLFRLVVVDDSAYNCHVRLFYDGCWSHVWLCNHVYTA